MDALLLLKTSPGAKSAQIASFLYTLPGARQVLFSEGPYSFVARVKGNGIEKTVEKKLRDNEAITSFETVEIGMIFRQTAFQPRL